MSPVAQRVRRTLWWSTIGIVLLIGAVAIVAIGGSARDDQPPPLTVSGVGPQGAGALARLLEEHAGVRVQPVSRYLDLQGRDLTDSTLVISDSAFFPEEWVQELLDTPADVVLLAPSSQDLRIIFDAERYSFVGGATSADCSEPASENADRVTIGQTYRTTDPEVSGCFVAPDNGYGLLQRDTSAGGSITAIGAETVFSNESLAAEGNAALALGLLGQHEQLYWHDWSYIDSLTTSAEGGTADITPDWVTPVLVLAALCGVSAAFWRGRRFGPLVAEQLPVTVRARESDNGRARLYQRSRDPAGVAALLVDGTVRRLGARHGVPPGDTDAVITATAARLHRPAAEVHAILHPHVTDEPSLIHLSESLRTLESDVQHALAPRG